MVGNTGRQSPADIHDSERAGLTPLRFAYTKAPLTVETDGHTLEVVYEDSAPDHVRVGHRTCQLQQFHFHHSAEHPLGGTVYPLEAHLVHDCGPDDLLVIGVMMDYLDGEPNEALGTALEHAARDGDTFIRDEVEVPGVLVDASDLLPRNRAYFTYEGSLTHAGLQRDRELIRAEDARLGHQGAGRRVHSAARGHLTERLPLQQPAVAAAQ